MRLLLLLLLILGSCMAFPLFELKASSEDQSTHPVNVHPHHKHAHKHHHRHKHRRRSLSSKEDAKTRRNKQVMLTKPYWPWP